MKNIRISKTQTAIATAAVEAFNSADASIWIAVEAGIKLGKTLKTVTARCTDDSGKLDQKAFDAALVALKLRDRIRGDEDKRTTAQREKNGLSRDNRSLCIQLADAGMPKIKAAYDRKLKTNPAYKASSISGMIKLIKATDPKAKAAAKNKPPMAIDQAISNYFAFARKHHGMTSTEAVAAVAKFYDNLPGAIVDADIEIGKQRKAA